MTNMPSRQPRAAVLGPSGEEAVEAPYFVETGGDTFSAGQIIAMLRRNLWLILIAAGIAVAAAAYVASRATTQYQATAVIRLIDRRPPAGVETTTDQPLGRVDPVLSELMVLQGRTVLGEAVDQGGFRLFSAATGAPADFVEEVEIDLPKDERGTIHLEFADDHVTYGPASDRRTASYGEPIVVDGARFIVPERRAERSIALQVVPRDVAIDYLQANLTTEQQHGTGGVDVSFTSAVPGIPPRAVNAIVQVFQEVNAELARQNFSRRRTFLEDQLRTTDSLLMVAQTGLSSFRSQEQAYSVAGEFSAEQSNLIQVEMQQAQLQGQLRMYENLLSRIEAIRSSGQSSDLNAWVSLPGIASDPAVAQVYSQLVSYHTERESMLAGSWARAASHPEVQRLNVLIASAEQRLTDSVRGQINSLKAQISSLGGLRGRALAKMSDLPRTEVQEVYLTQNLGALQQTANQLREDYQAVRLEEAAESGMVEIVYLASRGMPVRSSPWPKLLLGTFTGLMVGLVLAFVREKLDRSISGPMEIEQMLLIPNLAVIPESSPHLLQPSSNGDTRSRGTPEPPGTEAYRILRTNLLFSQGGLKTLVVTSAAPGEGKTMTAVNLAASCARQGMSVLLMECDLRRPSIARYFESSQESDLSNVMLDDRPWDEAISASGIPKLDVLLAGRAIPRAEEFLAGPDMKRLLDELSQRYDLVILDTSPLLVAADATVLGAIADGVLLVVRASKTERGAIQQAVHQLTLVGAHIVGTVLNDPEGAIAQYGHYYDYSAEYEAG
jgi:succinoglycan biosynthesis transport protein ExoP